MKQTLTILALMLNSQVIWAQVTDNQIIADVKKQESSTTSVRLDAKGISERIFENGVWQDYYRRMYHSVEKTKFNGVSYHYYGGIQYKKDGNSYSFNKLLVGEGHYEGFPDPDKTELMKFAAAKGTEFYGHYFNEIIGSENPEITLVKGEKWIWHSLKSVSGKVKCTFTVPTNYTTLEKAEHIFELRLYADGDKATNPSIKWSRLSVSEKSDEKKVIGTSTHTSAEIKAMPTLTSAAAGAVAYDELASLPKIGKIPTFETSIEMIYFTHNILMTKSANEIKTYLYHLVASNCRSGKQINMMTQSAQNWIDKLVNYEAVYKKTHCQYPAIKHKQSNMAELFDKNQLRKTRFSAQQENGSWYLDGVEYYPANASEINEIAVANKCGSESDYVVVKREVKTYKIGSAVDVTFSNGTFPCTVQKIDPSNPNRYYVIMNSNNSGYWMNEIDLKAGRNDVFKFKVGDEVDCEFSNGNFPCVVTGIDKAKQQYEVALSNGTKYWVYAQTVSERTFQPEKQVAGSSIKAGDTVYIATTKGKIKAKVLKILGGKCEIQYTDPKYSNSKQWVSLANVSK